MAKRQRREFAAGFCQQAEHLLYQQERPPFGLLYGPYQSKDCLGGCSTLVRYRTIAALCTVTKWLWRICFPAVWCVSSDASSISLPLTPSRQGPPWNLELAVWGFVVILRFLYVL